MNQILQSIGTAVALAIIFAIAKLFWDVVVIKEQVTPLVEWWRKTSMDALRIATNPTSRRLTELAARYIDSVNGKVKMATEEKQELVDGLREVMNDKGQYADKRQSASISLRFIESREGVLLRK